MIWPVSWPNGARVVAKLQPSLAGSQQNDEITRVLLEVSLQDAYENSMAWANAKLRVDQECCRLNWLGRQKSQGVHQKVRGCRMYQVASRTYLEKPADEDKVTAAIALVGVVAAVSLRLGVKVLRMTCLDDGSGKLVKYLQSFGLQCDEEKPANAGSSTNQSNPPILSTSCSELRQRCMPLEWSSPLERSIQLRMANK